MRSLTKAILYSGFALGSFFTFLNCAKLETKLRDSQGIYDTQRKINLSCIGFSGVALFASATFSTQEILNYGMRQ